MEKIDIITATSGQPNWLGIALMDMMGAAAPDHHDFHEKFSNVISPTNSFIEVEIKINGHEVKFSEFLKLLEDQHNQMIKSAAMELIKEKVNEIESLLNSIEHQVRDTLEVHDEG